MLDGGLALTRSYSERWEVTQIGLCDPRGPQLVVCAYEIRNPASSTNHVILIIREYIALYIETTR